MNISSERLVASGDVSDDVIGLNIVDLVDDLSLKLLQGNGVLLRRNVHAEVVQDGTESNWLELLKNFDNSDRNFVWPAFLSHLGYDHELWSAHHLRSGTIAV